MEQKKVNTAVQKGLSWFGAPSKPNKKYESSPFKNNDGSQVNLTQVQAVALLLVPRVKVFYVNISQCYVCM